MPTWNKVCRIEDIPLRGSRVFVPGSEEAACRIAVFRTADDQVFALKDACPHKGGPLSQGIVHGHQVTCPLHSWNINLEDGVACAPDQGCAPRYAVKVEDGEVWLEY